jgi:glycosyltransferase involved in cell wall biosynthesis
LTVVGKPPRASARIEVVDALLDRIRAAPSVLGVIALTDDLVSASAAFRAGTATDDAGRRLAAAMGDASDAPTAIAAAHALGRLPGRAPNDLLAEGLLSGSWLGTHVAWAMAARRPTEPLATLLVGLVADGRLRGMLAQRTLHRWSCTEPAMVARVLEGRLATVEPATARARVVETLGLLEAAAPQLARIAADDQEPAAARIAAIAALGDRPERHVALLQAIAAKDDASAATARLALHDHRSARTVVAPPERQLRLAQVHLGGRLDPALVHSGEGDTGGVATLLIQLGAALAADGRVAGVTTIGRGSASEALDQDLGSRSSHTVGIVPLQRHEDASFSGTWPAMVVAERGLRRILRDRSVSVLHLRMADVGTLAAATIARRHRIPTVFTLAPDPHALIVEMERSGELDRASFGLADDAAALWFRVRLVRRLADTAGQVVLFPRPNLEGRLRDLVGIDVASDRRRYHVVPEGIDIAPVDEARRAATRRGEPPARIVADLRAAIDALPPSRRGLPIVMSVGRLAEVKGMARIVGAFAAVPDLRERANLVVVGGDLDDPTPEERAEIERIEAALAAHPEARESVILLGHRPHDEVLRLLALADAGDAPWVARGGAYACGSRKEEFGLAIVEALAVGLPVVAPSHGGPASYVEDEITGRLVNAMDRDDLAAGILGALDLSDAPDRAERARVLVATRFTIRAMADALAPVYAAAQSTALSAAA